MTNRRLTIAVLGIASAVAALLAFDSLCDRLRIGQYAEIAVSVSLLATIAAFGYWAVSGRMTGRVLTGILMQAVGLIGAFVSLDVMDSLGVNDGFVVYGVFIITLFSLAMLAGWAAMPIQRWFRNGHFF